jgi:hypothetical protein
MLQSRPVKLFLPQATLEDWASADKADLKEGKLVLPAADGKPGAYAVVSAVHFKAIVSGADDKKLVSKVKTQEQLKSLGAEHFADSVLLGESAYEVVEGYIAEVPAPAPAAGKKNVNPEADLLAAFLLDKGL